MWRQGIPDNRAPVNYGMFHIIGLKMRYHHFIGIPDAVCVIRFNGVRSLYILYTNLASLIL